MSNSNFFCEKQGNLYKNMNQPKVKYESCGKLFYFSHKFYDISRRYNRTNIYKIGKRLKQDKTINYQLATRVPPVRQALATNSSTNKLRRQSYIVRRLQYSFLTIFLLPICCTSGRQYFYFFCCSTAADLFNSLMEMLLASRFNTNVRKMFRRIQKNIF